MGLTIIIYVLAAVAAAVLILLLLILATNNGALRGQSMFGDQFPPLTDDEFLARCKPGTNPEVALKVRAIISEQLCIPANQIYPEHRFIEDLHAD